MKGDLVVKLTSLRIKNYRSIVDSGDIRIDPSQAFVGENNVGKSNILKAIEVFLKAGTAGVDETNFFDKTNTIVITVTFNDLTKHERKALRPYLLGNKLVLEKHLSFQTETRSGKTKVTSEYHGYVAKPKNWWLSTEGVIENKGNRPNWHQVAEEYDILDYVQQEDGRVTKGSYEKGLRRLLQEREDIEYEQPVLGHTQALGLQPVLLNNLPEFYLLPAITDYSSEIDRRSSSTTFRRLMGDLADRILKADPRYSEVEASLQRIKCLLNPPASDEQRADGLGRLEILKTIEGRLRDTIAKLMPSVDAVHLEVILEETKDFFSRGVTLKIDDGILTDVLAKGHGLQRSVVFGLIQMLILSQRGQLLPTEAQSEATPSQPIILAIEEPELYVHPQMQRMVFSVLREFSQSDQVIYTTHCPAFVAVVSYHCIGVVKKESIPEGTRVHQCASGVLGSLDDRKGFQLLTSFGLEHNQMFFAKNIILVEGRQDVIAILATGRSLGLFTEFSEEIGYTIVVADNKDQIPKFQKLLHAFQLPYVVWLELDGKDENEDKNKRFLDLLADNRCVKLPGCLEDAAGHQGHFDKTYHAKEYFKNPNNITENLKKRVQELFEERNDA